jgi:transposase
MTQANVKWQHSSEELKRLYEEELRDDIKIKIFALWKISEGNSIADTSEMLGYKYNTVHSWAEIYKNHGFQGIKAKKPKEKRGRKCRLSDKQVIKIREMYRSGELPTTRMVREYIAKHYKITYSQPCIHYILKRMKVDEALES